MARRTKLEALATRSRILDTAELVFEQHGVSGTSLDDIAQAAHLTRGAIYWHFRNKADLFDAMMQRATLPLEGVRPSGAAARERITLAQLRERLVGVLQHVVSDPQMKRVFEIAIHKVEYVGEMGPVRQRQIDVRSACLGDIQRTLNLAMRRGELARRMSARTAALGLQALIDGLLQSWMLDPSSFDLVRVGRQALDAYLGGLAACATSMTPTPADVGAPPKARPAR